jgi:hypothetical protein
LRHSLADGADQFALFAPIHPPIEFALADADHFPPVAIAVDFALGRSVPKSVVDTLTDADDFISHALAVVFAVRGTVRFAFVFAVDSNHVSTVVSPHRFAVVGTLVFPHLSPDRGGGISDLGNRFGRFASVFAFALFVAFVADLAPPTRPKSETRQTASAAAASADSSGFAGRRD